MSATNRIENSIINTSRNTIPSSAPNSRRSRNEPIMTESDNTGTNTSNNTDNSFNSNQAEINTSSESVNTFSHIVSKSQIIRALVENILEIIDENIKLMPKAIEDQYSSGDIFKLDDKPPITLFEYVVRIVKHTKMEISSLVIGAIYIDRFCENKKYILTYDNVYKLILTSFLLTFKFNEDIKIDMKIYSEIVGVSAGNIRELEIFMYEGMDYRLYIDTDLYNIYFNYFKKYKKAKDKEDLKTSFNSCG